MVDGNHSGNLKLSSAALICTCDIPGHTKSCSAYAGNQPSEMKVKLLHSNARMPTRAHSSDSGFDVYAISDAVVPPHGHLKVELGIALEPPYGHEVQVRGRSGLAGKGVFVHPGTVDQNFRGQIATHLFNHNDKPYFVTTGDRVCQLVVMPIPPVLLLEVTELGFTDRGEKGFGSTGR